MISQNVEACIRIGNWIRVDIRFHRIPWTIGIYASLEVTKRWPDMAVLPRPIFSPTLASDSCFTQVSKWLNDCINSHTHPTCQQPFIPLLPSRVLDLGLNSSKLDLRLLTTHGESGNYIALSHRWGIDQTFSTKKASLLDREKLIKFKALPKTFQDAIIITRRIGVRYLWIDSLCIIQDDAEDWEKEAAMMSEVYMKALFTIAAASAFSDLEGFLLRRESVAGVKLHSLENTLGEPDIIARKQTIHSSIFLGLNEETVPLWSRAWALQEDVLSNRLLTYQKDEMTWECNSITACECGNGMLSDTKLNGARIGALVTSQKSQESYETVHSKDNHSKLYALWCGLIARYTARDLTRLTDTLAAISGIAATLQYSLKDEYFGGIWKRDLKRELVWGVNVSFPSNWFGKAPSNYRAPSFSWASIDVSISFICDRQSIQSPQLTYLRAMESCFQRSI